jgi:hypothetical protein
MGVTVDHGQLIYTTGRDASPTIVVREAGSDRGCGPKLESMATVYTAHTVSDEYVIAGLDANIPISARDTVVNVAPTISCEANPGVGVSPQIVKPGQAAVR